MKKEFKPIRLVPHSVGNDTYQDIETWSDGETTEERLGRRTIRIECENNIIHVLDIGIVDK